MGLTRALQVRGVPGLFVLADTLLFSGSPTPFFILFILKPGNKN